MFVFKTIESFPEDWIAKGYVTEIALCPNEEGNEEDFGESARTGKFEHPDGRIFATYCVEVPRNIMYYYDEERCDWIRLPLVWEMELPEIGNLITQIKTVLPEWDNDEDILLTLRDNDYILESTIESKFIEMSHMAGGGKGGGGKGGGSSSLKQIKKLKKSIKEMEERLERLNEENLELKDKCLTLEMEESSNVIKRGKNGGGDKNAGGGAAAEKWKKEAAKYKSKCEEYESEVEKYKERAKSMEEELRSFKKNGKASDMDSAKELTSLKAKVQSQEKLVQSLNEEVESYRRKKAIAEVGTEAIESSLKMVCAFKRDVKVFKMDINQLKLDAAKSLASIIPIIRGLNAAVHYVKLRIAENDKLVEEMRVKYQAEVHQAKLLYNKVQELRGNIRVFCRCRPDNTNELIHTFPTLTSVEVTDPQGNNKSFEFEKVFTPTSRQEEVFNEVEGMIKSSTDGYNVVILAYGQTGTGKTHTMIGPPEDPGVNVRALKTLFQITRDKSEVKFEITVSMLEIYNEQIFDLLQEPTESNLKKKLDVKMGPRGNYVPGLLEEEVVSEKSVMSVMEKAMKNRSIASTKMNSESSRSHLIMVVTVLGKNILSKETTVGKLTLVDLAGSERINKSGASGKQLMEAAAINKSLSTLGQVFTAIRSGSVHIPYRNSKLTYLLQSSLGGDAKAAMFINISPLKRDKTESYSTLQFGKSIRRVEMGIAKKNIRR